MKMPWSTIKVYCADTVELANMLGWWRRNSMALMGTVEFNVIAETNGPLLLQGEDEITGFYVEIPYAIAKEILLPQQIEQSFAAVKLGEVR